MGKMGVRRPAYTLQGDLNIVFIHLQRSKSVNLRFHAKSDTMRGFEAALSRLQDVLSMGRPLGTDLIEILAQMTIQTNYTDMDCYKEIFLAAIQNIECRGLLEKLLMAREQFQRLKRFQYEHEEQLSPNSKNRAENLSPVFMRHLDAIAHHQADGDNEAMEAEYRQASAIKGEMNLLSFPFNSEIEGIQSVIARYESQILAILNTLSVKSAATLS